MRSFQALSLLFTVASAAFTSAAPHAPHGGYESALTPVPTTVASLPVSTVAPPATTVVGYPGSPAASHPSYAPRDVVVSVPVILQTTINALTPLVNKLHAVVAVDATVEVVGAITADIKVIVNGAIADCKKLVGQPIHVVLGIAADVDVNVELKIVAELIVSLLFLVFQALAYLYALVGGLKTHVIFPLLCEVGALVGELVCLVLSLLGGLVATVIAIVLPLIGAIIKIILSLDVKVLIQVFALI